MAGVTKRNGKYNYQYIGFQPSTGAFGRGRGRGRYQPFLSSMQSGAPAWIQQDRPRMQRLAQSAGINFNSDDEEDLWANESGDEGGASSSNSVMNDVEGAAIGAGEMEAGDEEGAESELGGASAEAGLGNASKEGMSGAAAGGLAFAAAAGISAVGGLINSAVQTKQKEDLMDYQFKLTKKAANESGMPLANAFGFGGAMPQSQSYTSGGASITTGGQGMQNTNFHGTYSQVANGYGAMY